MWGSPRYKRAQHMAVANIKRLFGPCRKADRRIPWEVESRAGFRASPDSTLDTEISSPSEKLKDSQLQRNSDNDKLQETWRLD